jgi:hypothetical protein
MKIERWTGGKLEVVVACCKALCLYIKLTTAVTVYTIHINVKVLGILSTEYIYIYLFIYWSTFVMITLPIFWEVET